jgi:hypothetical protein
MGSDGPSVVGAIKTGDKDRGDIGSANDLLGEKKTRKTEEIQKIYSNEWSALRSDSDSLQHRLLKKL